MKMHCVWKASFWMLRSWSWYAEEYIFLPSWRILTDTVYLGDLSRYLFHPPLHLVFHQELTTLGFPSIYAESKGKELNLISIINCMNELLVLQHKNLRAQEEVEMQHLKLGSDMDHLQNCYAKLKVENKMICTFLTVNFFYLSIIKLQLYFYGHSCFLNFFIWKLLNEVWINETTEILLRSFL